MERSELLALHDSISARLDDYCVGCIDRDVPFDRVEGAHSMDRMTIVIPNYNKGPYIKDAVDSLLRQDVSSWHAIIMDDGSNDDSQQFLQTYAPLKDSRFSVHFNEQRNGKAYCMNRLIQLAATDIIGELDSDDALAERCIREVLKAFDTSTSGFVYTNFTFCDEHLNKIHKGWAKRIPKGRTVLDDTYVAHFRSFRKSAFLKTPGLDEELLSAVDKDLIYKLEEVTSFHFVDLELYYHRVLASSLSRGPENEAKALQNCALAKARALERRGVRDMAIR
jgi:glycosyltransferase involved in cell wall biosynthesis